MEILRGKHATFIDAAELAAQIVGYSSVHIDLGTGDGRLVAHLAKQAPQQFVIGIDACRDGLSKVSRRTAMNALFVIANAQALPEALYGTATQITINFPWGSLLDGLLSADSALLDGLQALARPNAQIEVRLNGGALTLAGYSLEAGGQQVRKVLGSAGFAIQPHTRVDRQALRLYPTTWAKRLAFGRDPQAVYLKGTRR
jgi:16S rRNA (adenine(1408)-N(1))-methyltransferase